MSITEALGRINSIQSTLAQVSGAAQRPATTATGAAAGSTSSNTAASAAAQLAAATLAGSGASPTAGTADAFSGALASVLAPGSGTTAGAKATGADEVGPVKKHGSTTGADVVATAKKYLGVPYVWGGNNPAIGLDCSSLVQHTFRDLGIDLPRVARQQATVGTEVPSLSQAKPGDLLVLRNGKHIGIYLGDNKMIHAPRPGEKVSIRELFETDKDIMTIRRIVPAETPAPTVAPSGSAAASLALQQAAFAGAAS
ncbi:C40 family peptidase [Arthrobacter sp. JSM 101049]|uniref:C40 family peptidase n=1 Tax=Arthrobacter sp. JSM 101049 TaxID=929097 RepID=UPI00356848AB